MELEGVEEDMLEWVDSGNGKKKKKNLLNNWVFGMVDRGGQIVETKSGRLGLPWKIFELGVKVGSCESKVA